MGEMHKWEVVGHKDESLLRAAVPDGWLYSDGARIVYVPAPPRLVRLERTYPTNAPDNPVFVNPASVMSLMPSQWVPIGGGDTVHSTWLDMGGETGSFYVHGTPEEVASKLGLEVTS